jgi:hypothetical protein
LSKKAVGYWLKAGQQALARSAMTEAVAQLQKGLALLAGLPDDPWRQQEELDLQIEHPIAHVLRNESPEALHGLSDALLIGGNDLAQVLERPNASFRRHCANGPTRAPTTTRISDAAELLHWLHRYNCTLRYRDVRSFIITW